MGDTFFFLGFDGSNDSNDDKWMYMVPQEQQELGASIAFKNFNIPFNDKKTRIYFCN